MPDYLREVGGFARVVSIVGLLLSTLLCGAALLLVVGVLLSGQFWFPGGVPFWPSAMLFGFLTFASAFLLARLLASSRSANGVTIMPTWFIELFGAVFAAGIIFAAVAGGEPLMLVELFGVVAAMIGVRWLLRRKARQEAQLESQEAGTDDETD